MHYGVRISKPEINIGTYRLVTAGWKFLSRGQKHL